MRHQRRALEGAPSGPFCRLSLLRRRRVEACGAGTGARRRQTVFSMKRALFGAMSGNACECGEPKPADGERAPAEGDGDGNADWTCAVLCRTACGTRAHANDGWSRCGSEGGHDRRRVTAERRSLGSGMGDPGRRRARVGDGRGRMGPLGGGGGLDRGQWCPRGQRAAQGRGGSSRRASAGMGTPWGLTKGRRRATPPPLLLCMRGSLIMPLGEMTL